MRLSKSEAQKRLDAIGWKIVLYGGSWEAESIVACPQCGRHSIHKLSKLMKYGYDICLICVDAREFVNEPELDFSKTDKELVRHCLVWKLWEYLQEKEEGR